MIDITSELQTYIKEGIWILGMLGVAIEITPNKIIKVNPIRFLVKKFSRFFLSEIYDKLENIKRCNKEFRTETNETTSQIKEDVKILQDKCDENELMRKREYILNFSNSCMRHLKHTQEEFNQIIQIHDEYSKYISDHNLKNGHVDIAYDFIEETYHNCLTNNTFLKGGKENDL